MSDQPLYSGWRRKKGLGFFGFSQGETAVLAVLLFVVLLIGGTNPFALLYLIPLFLLSSLAFFRYNGMPGWDYLRREMSWRWAKNRGYLEFQSGLVNKNPLPDNVELELPGLLASTKLMGIRDGYNEWALVWDQTTDFLTVNLLCNVQSPWLVDTDQFNGWVHQWHQWLASLGFEPQIEHISVTVESAQASGAQVAENIRNSLVPTAPAHAYDVVSSLAYMGRESASIVETRIAITFNPRKGSAKGRTVDERAAEISRLLVSLENKLLSCGVSSVRRMSPQEMIGNLRIAYDPDAHDEVSAAQAVGAVDLRWVQAGPMAAKEDRDFYMHDSGISVSWVWSDGPRSPVPATILMNMVNPGPYQKRFTIFYEPSDPGETARKLENEKLALEAKAMLMKRSSSNETERARLDRQFAEMAAREEAKGSGFGDISVYLTVTVGSTDHLEDAIIDIGARAAQSKLKLRLATCSHAAIFAAGLGVGIRPSAKRGKGVF